MYVIWIMNTWSYVLCNIVSYQEVSICVRYLSETKMFRLIGILLHVEFTLSDSRYKNYDEAAFPFTPSGSDLYSVHNKQYFANFTCCRYKSTWTKFLYNASQHDWGGMIDMSLYSW
jgi:hypothetical protein